jgi:hypothetical protein
MAGDGARQAVWAGRRRQQQRQDAVKRERVGLERVEPGEGVGSRRLEYDGQVVVFEENTASVGRQHRDEMVVIVDESTWVGTMLCVCRALLHSRDLENVADVKALCSVNLARIYSHKTQLAQL